MIAALPPGEAEMHEGYIRRRQRCLPPYCCQRVAYAHASRFVPRLRAVTFYVHAEREDDDRGYR